MLSPLDNSVILINSLFFDSFSNVTVKASVFGKNGTLLWSKKVDTNIKGNAVETLFTVPSKNIDPNNLRFVLLETLYNSESVRNVYWLSSEKKQDVFNYNSSSYTPLLSYADFTELITLKSPVLQISNVVNTLNSTSFKIQNAGTNVAFFLRFRIVDGTTSQDVLPAIFSDNFVTLFANDSVDVQISYKQRTGKVKLVVEPFSDFVNR